MDNSQPNATASRTTTSRRNFVKFAGVAGVLGASALFGCSQQEDTSSSSAGVELDSAAWQYDADNDIYYQIGVQYCTNPQAENYESMGIYVPGAYFTAEDNGDGTFTCAPNSTGTVGGYTADTAPIVIPINTAGYSAQAAPTAYDPSGVTDYLAAGFIYVYAGCRGRQLSDDACGAAPWGVTDLKAAVRTLRYNEQSLPGNTERIFSFGHSGGGAQSAVLGATGDSDAYADYLAEIGAPTADASGNEISDAIYGAMCWCPITSLTAADAAYEWNMGQFASGGTRADGTFTRQLSQDLAASYASYINGLGLVDGSGNELTLEDGGEGVACAGSYYDYVVAQVELSLNNFLADTTFPIHLPTISTATWVPAAVARPAASFPMARPRRTLAAVRPAAMPLQMQAAVRPAAVRPAARHPRMQAPAGMLATPMPARTPPPTPPRQTTSPASTATPHGLSTTRPQTRPLSPALPDL